MTELRKLSYLLKQAEEGRRSEWKAGGLMTTARKGKAQGKGKKKGRPGRRLGPQI